MGKRESKKKSYAVICGIGLDNKDGHKRITKGDNFYIFGGSKKTHEKMVEKVIEFNEVVKKSGKRLEDLSKKEYTNIVKEVGGDKLNWFYMPQVD